VLWPVAVEKVQFSPKQPKFGEYKMARKFGTSFEGHPSAILFLRISAEGVFQQPRLLTPMMPRLLLSRWNLRGRRAVRSRAFFPASLSLKSRSNRTSPCNEF